jgi:ACS family hexuronate transporter-like MFS transporter
VWLSRDVSAIILAQSRMKSGATIQETVVAPCPVKKPVIKHLRWYIAGLLCLASQLNYLDRQTLSVLAGTIEKDLHLTDHDYSIVTFTFLWTYAVAYAVSGFIVDRLGSRRSFLTFVSGWSLANMLHALVRSLPGLTLCRSFLALMEPANFPAGIKAVTEWFPVRERALAVGIFNSGTAVGNALAVPVAAFLTLNYGWRSAFVFTGALGFVWVLLWALCYRLPQDHPRLGEQERALIMSGREAETAAENEKVSSWQILKMPAAWGCMLARMLTDPISYFLFFWTPKYLETERGFDLKHVGMYAWIPFAALTFGNLFSGACPRYLVSRGWSLNKARKRTMFFVSCGMLLSFFLLTKVSTPFGAVAMLAVVMFGHTAWGNITLPAEIFPKNVVGTVTGFGGCLGGIAGGLVQLAVASVVVQHGYTPIFAICAVMYLVAFALVHLLVGELGVIRKIPSNA